MVLHLQWDPVVRRVPLVRVGQHLLWHQARHQAPPVLECPVVLMVLLVRLVQVNPRFLKTLLHCLKSQMSDNNLLFCFIYIYRLEISDDIAYLLVRLVLRGPVVQHYQSRH